MTNKEIEFIQHVVKHAVDEGFMPADTCKLLSRTLITIIATGSGNELNDHTRDKIEETVQDMEERLMALLEKFAEEAFQLSRKLKGGQHGKSDFLRRN